MKTDRELENGCILAGIYKIIHKIDQGAFGKIFKCININKNNGEEYAIKMESMRAEHPQLIMECKLYNTIHTDSAALDRGIPNIYHCGGEGQYFYLVMELMGPSLESLLHKMPLKKFSLKTVLMLTDQMISRIEYLHSRSYLHRDIKPDNFCMGLGKNSNKLYILDFGLAKSYLNKGKHIVYRQGKSLTGTARYASINTHKGFEQSCRDDMESIAYVALYCLFGVLPWQNQNKGTTKADKYQRIKETKIKTTTQQLCKGCPQEFVIYLQTVKALDFAQKPKYSQLRQLFKNVWGREGLNYDYQYDWTSKSQTTVKKQTTIKKPIAISKEQQMKTIRRQDYKDIPIRGI